MGNKYFIFLFTFKIIYVTKWLLFYPGRFSALLNYTWTARLYTVYKVLWRDNVNSCCLLFYFISYIGYFCIFLCFLPNQRKPKERWEVVLHAVVICCCLTEGLMEGHCITGHGSCAKLNGCVGERRVNYNRWLGACQILLSGKAWNKFNLKWHPCFFLRAKPLY